MERLPISRSLFFNAPAVISLVAASIAAILVYRACLHPLGKIPGPRIAALTSLWLTYHYWRGTWHDDILRLHDKYGPVVRIGPNEVALVDAAAAKQLYGHGKKVKKTNWYSTWIVPGRGRGVFSEQDHNTHSFLRKRVSAAYAMSSILKYEVYIQSCMDLCFEKLRKYAAAGEIVNMSEWTNALAFDVVGELAFGEKLGHLNAESADVGNLRHGIAQLFFVAANLGYVWGQSGLINSNPLVAFVMALFGAKPAMLEFANWTKKKVDARRQSDAPSDREDMLAHFIRMKSIDGDHPASDIEVIAESMNIIGAGADTTSIGMRTCLYYLSLNPTVYSRLQKEIDEYYDTHDLKVPITYQQTQELEYLKAVVLEALRLFPSITYQLPRYSPAAGIHVAKYYIPEGYEVGVSCIAQNRDKAVYGEDANEFRPERWLESKEKNAQLQANNMTFGGNGPRTCIGKNIAL
ncbi:hypothetical protein FE257_006450 [Aspergillus nanangensis]|uniref:Cytochrome P450 n=1 Tax=Aspergillus nanangensis TaxID=2582783 RepID=A0AAD4GZB1_ASPNN|nr:hypothetical protein FE257_006450 [Aspergillus nanangensis]